MKSCACHSELTVLKGSAIGPAQKVRNIILRVLATFRWLVPALILAILPKCPLCFATYVAVGTGLGLSLATAGYVRFTLVIVCLCSLSYVGLKWILSKKKHLSDSQT